MQARERQGRKKRLAAKPWAFILAASIALGATALAAGGSTIIRVQDWSASEPLAALDLDDGTLRLYLLDRSRPGEPDEPYALLHFLHTQVYPGLLEALKQETLRRGVAAGILEAGGDWSGMTQSQVDELNEILRRLIYDEIRPVMQEARALLREEGVVNTGMTGYAVVSPGLLEKLRNRTRSFPGYGIIGDKPGGTRYMSVICDSCGEGEYPTVFCPAGQCLEKCGGEPKNCME